MKFYIRQFQLKEIYVRWIGILVLAFIMMHVMNEEHEAKDIANYAQSFLFTALYWNMAFFTFVLFRRRFPLIRQTPTRLVWTALSLILLFMILEPLLCMSINGDPASEAFSSHRFFQKLSVSLFACLIIGSFYENVYFFQQWKDSIRQNEALKNQQMRTQLEVLQNQMSPHFLFNSLNTLSSLISDQPEEAQRFTERLSEVYRYILRQKDRELVSLDEELQFVRTYCYLLQIRYPHNLHVHIAPELIESRFLLPPLTIQMLVENAIKHNVISEKKPLYVKLFKEAEDIVVENNLQTKRIAHKSTKTGLANIRKRYAFYSDQAIRIEQTDAHYRVYVPLLRMEISSPNYSPSYA